MIENERFEFVVHVSSKLQNLVISNRCYAEYAKIWAKHITIIFLLSC